jgi:hypothetical protein
MLFHNLPRLLLGGSGGFSSWKISFRCESTKVNVFNPACQLANLSEQGEEDPLLNRKCTTIDYLVCACK